LVKNPKLEVAVEYSTPAECFARPREDFSTGPQKNFFGRV